MRFCTVINCMDGRVQLPVIEYLKKRFDVEYVDSITEPGPILILSEQKPAESVRAIVAKLRFLIERRETLGVAIVGHHDCLANPVQEDRQKVQIRRAMHFLRDECKEIKLIGLWVDEHWKVHEVAL